MNLHFFRWISNWIFIIVMLTIFSLCYLLKAFLQYYIISQIKKNCNSQELNVASIERLPEYSPECLPPYDLVVDPPPSYYSLENQLFLEINKSPN